MKTLCLLLIVTSCGHYGHALKKLKEDRHAPKAYAYEDSCKAALLASN